MSQLKRGLKCTLPPANVNIYFLLLYYNVEYNVFPLHINYQENTSKIWI